MIITLSAFIFFIQIQLIIVISMKFVIKLILVCKLSQKNKMMKVGMVTNFFKKIFFEKLISCQCQNAVQFPSFHFSPFYFFLLKNCYWKIKIFLLRFIFFTTFWKIYKIKFKLIYTGKILIFYKIKYKIIYNIFKK